LKLKLIQWRYNNKMPQIKMIPPIAMLLIILFKRIKNNSKIYNLKNNNNNNNLKNNNNKMKINNNNKMMQVL